MESFSDLGAILLMQGFNGLSVFSVLLLMALGLAIIFGQMGVINMAHGEFLAVGAYCTYLCSELVQQYAPGMMPAYFFFAIVLAFAVTFALGWLAEWLMIRHLYRRPLDTLLATWGLSLVLQQSLRSIFGPREVSPTLPDWLMDPGSRWTGWTSRSTACSSCRSASCSPAPCCWDCSARPGACMCAPPCRTAP